MNTKIATVGIFLLKAVAAALMLQSLFYKFSGAEESVYIFTTMGMEPWGRIGTGVVELIAAVLLFVPRATVFGALLGAGVMSGAIASHLTKLGIVVKNDGGQLFAYAIIVFSCCTALIWINRVQLLSFVQRKA
jgi:uncharacterized membrane protein YphA (DoxX/SURF4 family)